MPKRHRQPEPIDILSAGKSSSSATTRRAGGATDPHTAAMDASIDVFPATPAALREQRRQDAAGLSEDAEPSSAGTSSSITSNSDESDNNLAYNSSDYDDDGNQKDDDAADLLDDEDTGDDDAMRRAVREFHRKQKKQQQQQGGSDSDLDDSDLDDSDLDDSDFDSDDEEDEEGDMFDDDEEGDDDENAAAASDASDDDDDEEGDGSGLVTVDFGVYDMAPKHVDAVMHLMDQLCPDKMNEVDRDALGAALAENPYTYIVKVNNNEEEEEDEEEEGEEEEVYGLASVLDVAHGVKRHSAAFKPLCKLLKEEVWRTVSPGMPPVEILLDIADSSSGDATKKSNNNNNNKNNNNGLAKCVLLVTEYIRNVPLELTVQILEDLVGRLDTDANKATTTAPGSGKRADAVEATPACMVAVLAKVQRAQDAPVTLEKPSDEASSTQPAKKKSRKDQRGDASTAAAGAGGGSDEALDLSSYIFWREEDNVLFDFRDKRVAALAYRCRPQYDGQPESDIPLSVLFVLQYGAVRQAMDEMRKRSTTHADVVHY